MELDKSLYYYGGTFHLLVDPLLGPHRKVIVELIPDGASVLDAGCGTGELSLLLRKKRTCRVIGVDLSLRMVHFAQGRNPYNDVVFLHGDVSSLSELENRQFDYGVLCQVLHELPRAKQVAALTELVRLARANVLVDYGSPLPRNATGIASRMIEATLGRDHHKEFRAYLEGGGLIGIIAEAGLESRVARRLQFSGGSSQVVVLS